jgi:hypothetical protein
MREAAALWVLLAVAAVAVAFAFLRIQDVQSHQNDALHSIICFVQKRELASPVLTAKQKRQAVRFWVAALKNARLAPCSKGGA